jgi:fatty-acyl-CoA synthase
MGKLSQSYVHGASQLPLIGDTIGVHLDHIAARAPERPALIVRQQRTRWSYAEFQRRAEELAAGLIALGFKPGDRLGIWSPNNAEWVLLQFATAKAGIILVNINPAYRLHELEYALNTVGCLGVIVAPVFKTSDYIAMVRSLCPELGLSPPGALASSRLPALRWVIRLGTEKSAGMLNFDDIASEATLQSRRRLAELRSELQFDDPINIQFTSGTTGNPKGATLTHHNILNNGFFIGEAWFWAISPASPMPAAWCFRAKASRLWPSWRRLPKSVAPVYMASRPCSSPCSITRVSGSSMFRAFALESWQAAPAPSR